ncbi:hypothetical protein ACRRTK_013185 [Alexandromys fortis]
MQRELAYRTALRVSWAVEEARRDPAGLGTLAVQDRTSSRCGTLTTSLSRWDTRIRVLSDPRARAERPRDPPRSITTPLGSSPPRTHPHLRSIPATVSSLHRDPSNPRFPVQQTENVQSYHLVLHRTLEADPGPPQWDRVYEMSGTVGGVKQLTESLEEFALAVYKKLLSQKIKGWGCWSHVEFLSAVYKALEHKTPTPVDSGPEGLGEPNWAPVILGSRLSLMTSASSTQTSGRGRPGHSTCMSSDSPLQTLSPEKQQRAFSVSPQEPGLPVTPTDHHWLEGLGLHVQRECLQPALDCKIGKGCWEPGSGLCVPARCVGRAKRPQLQGRQESTILSLHWGEASQADTWGTYSCACKCFGCNNRVLLTSSGDPWIPTIPLCPVTAAESTSLVKGLAVSTRWVKGLAVSMHPIRKAEEKGALALITVMDLFPWVCVMFVLLVSRWLQHLQYHYRTPKWTWRAFGAEEDMVKTFDCSNAASPTT